MAPSQRPASPATLAASRIAYAGGPFGEVALDTRGHAWARVNVGEGWTAWHLITTSAVDASICGCPDGNFYVSVTRPRHLQGGGTSPRDIYTMGESGVTVAAQV
jgi:hypothetical protein